MLVVLFPECNVLVCNPLRGRLEAGRQAWLRPFSEVLRDWLLKRHYTRLTSAVP